MDKVARSPHDHRRHRGLWWTLGAIGALLIGTIVAFQVSPWPGAMVVRAVFTNGAANVSKIMAPFAPDNVESTFNVDYKPGAPSAQLDVYWPDATSAPLPTIVWTHGGAWISGSKDNNVAYYQLLASKGYTVVGLNYGYGPETRYPEAVFEINDALAFLQLLAPLAPHIAEELWSRLGGATIAPTLGLAGWPAYDPAKLVATELKVVVQINGKKRAEILLPVGTSEADATAAAQAHPDALPHLAGKSIKRIIYVPGKILNIVVA
jgi:hypothetical protein